MPQFLDHLHIVFHPFLDALGLDAVAQFLEVGYLLHQVVLYVMDGDIGLFLRCHKEVGRVEFILLETGQTIEGDGIHFFQRIDLVVPEGDTQHHLAVGHRNIHRVALHSEVASLQVDVVADIQGGDEIS